MMLRRVVRGAGWLAAVGLLVFATSAESRAGPLSILDYGGAGSLSFLDNDGSHVYTPLPAGDPNWQNAAFLAGFDVIAVGSLSSSPQAVTDLANAAVIAVTTGANAVLGELFHGHGTAGERQLWTQSIEFAGAGGGVGWVSSLADPYDFTPFAPSVNIGGPVGLCADGPMIVQPSHPIVAGLTDPQLVMSCTTHAVFTAVPAGFSVIVTDTQAGGAPIVLATGGQVIPEPGSVVLLGIGMVGMAGYGWRRRRRKA